MRYFILANGKASRWNNYLGVDKQMIPIDGEPLLYRTVRLLKECMQSDIWIVGDYDIEGVTKIIPTKESIIGKYDIVEDYVNDVDSFALLYGDCYYTKEIIIDLVNRKTEQKWLHWACNRANSITGKPYPEGYIHSVYDKEFWFNKCKEYHKLLENGLKHTIDWMFLRHLLGIDLNIHQPELMKDNEVDWEDETDDFDYPIDYDRWMTNCRGVNND